jgi:hypothetical protein
MKNIPRDLGRCTMTGCNSQAFWVHGPLLDYSGEARFVWRLCNCCQESVLAADHALREAEISEPDEVPWILEAARTELAMLSKSGGKR